MTFLLVMLKYEGKQKFQPTEYPRSGSKAMSVEERKKESSIFSVNNGQFICLNQEITGCIDKLKHKSTETDTKLSLWNSRV